MARILAISSQVARGHVGLSIIVPALQALGHDVVALPSVLLSNHPGHAHVAGTAIDPETLHAMLDALSANGWLSGLDAIITGYLPTTDHVAFACRAVNLVRSASPGRTVPYLCDPVLGDDPKGLYIDARAAAAIRADLTGLADYATPNRFELSFLTGQDIRSAPLAFAAGKPGPTLIATSIPSASQAETLNTLIAPSTHALTRVPLRSNAPHGTGDLFSALFLSAHLDGASDADALSSATAGVDQTLAGSTGSSELQLSALPARDRLPAPWPIELQTS